MLHVSFFQEAKNSGQLWEFLEIARSVAPPPPLEHFKAMCFEEFQYLEINKRDKVIKETRENKEKHAHAGFS